MTKQLLTIDESAIYLGCRPRTLRKIIDNSRLRLKGIPAGGPTIQFFQARTGGAILFRREWLDAYIDAGTHRPESAPLLTKSARRKPKRVAEYVPSADAHGFGPGIDD